MSHPNLVCNCSRIEWHRPAHGLCFEVETVWTKGLQYRQIAKTSPWLSNLQSHCSSCGARTVSRTCTAGLTGLWAGAQSNWADAGHSRSFSSSNGLFKGTARQDFYTLPFISQEDRHESDVMSLESASVGTEDYKLESSVFTRQHRIVLNSASGPRPSVGRRAT